MRDPTKKQLKDLISELIKIRKERVDGYGGDFIFNTKEFNSPYFSRDNENTKFDEIVNALKKIIEDMGIGSIETEINAIKEIKTDKSKYEIKIIGSRTDRLELFLAKRLSKGGTKRKYTTIPIHVPENIHWEDIEIKFEDENNVKIKIGNESYDSDCVKMGFADRRKNKVGIIQPLASWDFLSILAQNNGDFPIGRCPAEQKKKNEKRKQEATKILRGYFSIADDPISYLENEQIYKSRIKLIPEPIFRDQWEDRNIVERER